jgi:predicted HD phosphohydrolase
MDVVALFAARGAERYEEEVTQLEHALQCAALARRARADDEVVLAALLHDVGHLVTRAPEGPDGHHGHEGAELLRPWVPPRVAWLVEHHVVAKRYLCTVNPRYTGRLSPASIRSLAAQGAVLDLEQRLALETQPWFGDAVRIRHWDDEAKIVDALTPPLVAYRPLIERCLGPHSWTSGRGID